MAIISSETVTRVIRETYEPMMRDEFVREITGQSLSAHMEGRGAPRAWALGPAPDWTTALCEGTEGWAGSTWRYDTADREDRINGIMEARNRIDEHRTRVLLAVAVEWGLDLDDLARAAESAACD